MECNKRDCVHWSVCQEWISLGNDNFIIDSYGNCENYAINSGAGASVPISPEFLIEGFICGYRVRDLIIIAQKARASGLDELRLKNYGDGFKDGYAKAYADIEEALAKSLSDALKGSEV